MKSNMRVVYDGWPLVREASGPEALHLLAILAHLPVEVEALVALPEEAPDWFPENIQTQIVPQPRSAFAKLAWQQRILPQFTRQVEAGLLHVATPHASLFGDHKTLISPGSFAEGSDFDQGFAKRLQEAAGRGGAARASALLWPSDLGKPQVDVPVFELPPTVHPDFQPAGEPVAPTIDGLVLPENYVLYHGPINAAALRKLLVAWTWGASSIGEYYPLLLLGLDTAARAYVESLLPSFNLTRYVQVLPDVAPTDVAALYRGSSAVYHPAAVSAWSGPVRHALACTRPIAGLRTPMADAIAGQAAYLVEDDERSLGSAFIGVIVKEEIYETLMAQARERTRGWQSGDFGTYLKNVYGEVMANS